MTLKGTIDDHWLCTKINFHLKKERCAQRVENRIWAFWNKRTLRNIDDVNTQEICVMHVHESFVLFLQLFCKSEITDKIRS